MVILAVAVILICVFITGTYIWILYLKYRQRILWNELYALMKTKFASVANLLFTLKEIYNKEPELYKMTSGCVGSFILSKTPAEAANAHVQAQAALNILDESIKKYPLAAESDGYILFKSEMMKTDEKIGFASKFYDESVINFNNIIKRAPFAAVAAIFGIKAKGNLKLD